MFLVQRLRESSLWQVGGDSSGFGQSEVQTIKDWSDEVWLCAVGLTHVIPALITPIHEESIVVELPAQRNDLESLVELLSKVEEALAQLVSEEGIGGELQVGSWETGSFLVFLWLKTTAAVALVGRTLKSAALAYQEMQKGRILGQYARRLKIQNELAEALEKAAEKELNMLIEREARAIDAETFESRDHERTARIEHSIRLLADLLLNEARIYPALDMPSEQKEKFPDLHKLGLALSEIKNLEDSTDRGGEPTNETEAVAGKSEGNGS
jgi:hypothetical protein